MKAIIYARVACKQQVRTEFSLYEQEKLCRAYCERKGIEVLQVFQECSAGKSMNRPAFRQAIQYCKKNKDQVDLLILRNTHFFLSKIDYSSL